MEEAEPLDVDRLGSIIESMLLVSSEPLLVERIREIVLAESPVTDPALIDTAVAALLDAYADGGRRAARGFRLDFVADGLQLRTPAENAPFLRRLLAARPPKLTKPAMETLAVIAYRQPVTKPEIESIRGVDVGAVLKALLDRELIRIIGKSDDLGRPILYGTTKKFLELFGLRSLGSLPTLREYHELDEVHQQQVDELYESEPRISDLAAKAAFLIERKHDADLDALAAAEASVAQAGDRAAAALAAGDAQPEAAAPGDPAAPTATPPDARPTDPPPPAPADAADARPTDPPPPEAAPRAPRARKKPRGARAPETAPDADAAIVADLVDASSSSDDPVATAAAARGDALVEAAGRPRPEDEPVTEDLSPVPRKTKLRRKKPADESSSE